MAIGHGGEVLVAAVTDSLLDESVVRFRDGDNSAPVA
jgi:hypothetical protein